LLDCAATLRRFFAQFTNEVHVNYRSSLLIVPISVLSMACQKEPHRIGVWTGATGANVAKMVESETNFKGGVADRRMEVRLVARRAVARDSLTPPMLLASLDSMANDKSVLAVVMRMTDSITERAAAKFEQSDLPYLITTPVDENYAATHPHAFLLAPSIQSEADFLASQGLARAKSYARKVAILHTREEHAVRQTEALVAALAKRGVKPAMVLSFAPDADEYNMTAKAHEIASVTPDILYFVGRSPSLMLLHSVIRNRVPHVLLFGSSLVESWHVYINPSRIYTGLHFVRYADPMSTDSAMTSLRGKLEMWIGRNELNTEELLALDGERAVAAAMKDSAVTRPLMLQHLRTKPFEGMTGTLRFGANQRTPRTLYLAEVRDDSIVTVARSDTVYAAALRRR
jgi:ABC-type branched-subunit amino acid transport system substrate-binding protein